MNPPGLYFYSHYNRKRMHLQPVTMGKKENQGKQGMWETNSLKQNGNSVDSAGFAGTCSTALSKRFGRNTLIVVEKLIILCYNKL